MHEATRYIAAVIASVVIVLVVGFATYSTKAVDVDKAISTVLVSDKSGKGSGVHIGNGFIISAAHVVQESKTMEVEDSYGGTRTAIVLWSNPAYDVALMRISDYDQVASSPLACSAQYKVDQNIEAVGNPMKFKFIHTWGKVASDRVEERYNWKSSLIVNLTIIPGMSGGPVFDEFGKVIGISVATMVVPTSAFSTSMVSIGVVVPSPAICSLLAKV